jgi:hypothetical protein
MSSPACSANPGAGQRIAEVIVAETGDGVMGEYGVQAILADPGLRALNGAFVFCANDPVGVAGGVHYLKDRFGIEVDVITGPATDNRVGTRFIEREVGVPACNARLDTEGLLARVREVTARRERCRSEVA